MAVQGLSSITLKSFVLALLVCRSWTVDLTLDVLEEDSEEERECYGTNVGFGYSGTLEMHFQNLKKRFTGCFHIIGNLEITNLMDPNIDYNLDFLRNVRYVSGSVLIGLNTEVSLVPLLNLEIIRGNKTYWLQEDDYSLVVVLTAHSDDPTMGLKQIQMPKLKEITNGKVLFTENPALGYVNTIDWRPILRGRAEDVHFYSNAYNDSVTNGTVSPFCNNGPRWGDDGELCQVVDTLVCHEDCNGRCFGPSEDECCHDSCAIGCSTTGPEHCFGCKDYIYDNHCAGFCPDRSYPLNQNCVKY